MSDFCPRCGIKSDNIKRTRIMMIGHNDNVLEDNIHTWCDDCDKDIKEQLRMKDNE